jgi:ATP-dependent protease ClpP protease subunit
MNRPFRTTRRIANLRAGRNDWYRIENSASGSAQVHIYDEIGFFGVTASDLVKDLAGVSGDLDIHIDCPGGDVFEAITIYNALQQHKGDVSVYVDGLAASAASFIAQAASPGKLAIARNASMMIHDAFGMGIGNSADMRKLADLLDEQSENIASIYADRSGRPADEFRQAMLTETWYVGQKAVDAGLADQVTAGRETSNSWDLSVFAKTPGLGSVAQHTFTPACDGHHDPGPCPRPDEPAAFDFDPDMFLSLLKEASK